MPMRCILRPSCYTLSPLLLHSLAFLTLLLITLPSPVYAGETLDVIPCCSKHRQPGYNGFNPGFGQEYVINNKWSWGVTAAINSKESLALYSDLTWKPLHFGRLKLGLTGLCALGYDGNKVLCVPPLPSAEFWVTDKWAVDGLLVPGNDGVLIIRFKFKKGVLE